VVQGLSPHPALIHERRGSEIAPGYALATTFVGLPRLRAVTDFGVQARASPSPAYGRQAITMIEQVAGQDCPAYRIFEIAARSSTPLSPPPPLPTGRQAMTMTEQGCYLEA
jgi:hypothetical protein